MYRTRSRNVFSVVSMITALSAAVTAAGEDGSPYYYSYFKEQIPIALDRTRIAILDSMPSREGEGEALEAALSGAGIGRADLQPLPLTGWYFAPMTARGMTDREVKSLVATLAAESAATFASPVFKDYRGDPLIITSDLLIGFESEVTAADAEALLTADVDGVIKERDYGDMPGVYRVGVNSRDGFEVLALANALAQLPEIRFAESNMIMTLRKSLIPDDPMFSQLWGLHNTTNDMDMDAPEAWDITTGDESVKVIILDDGVQQDHPDINQVPGRDQTGHDTGGGPWNECDNHGTAVAGCVSAIINNATGIVGVAPDCKVASAKVSMSNVPCDGSGWFMPDWYIGALNWATSIGARVTNTSSSFSPNSTITTKFNTTRAAGMIHFAASGNDNYSWLPYPANLDSVNAVGGVDPDGDRWVWPGQGGSNYGTGLMFMAPSVSIRATDRTGAAGYEPGDFTWVDGTSFASPYAAGVAALLLALNIAFDVEDVEEAMKASCVDRGDPGYDTEYGWGFVNAHGALLEAAVGACCLADGSCNMMSEVSCGGAPGFYAGDFVDCPPDPPCEPVDTIMTSVLSSSGAFPDTSVSVQVFVEEVTDLQTYQAMILVTRTSGEGSLDVTCPGGVVVDTTRPDFVFADLPPGSMAIAAVQCEALQLGATVFGGGSVDVGSTKKYLGHVTLNVSADATPDTTFEISIAPVKAQSFLLDSGAFYIPTRYGPGDTLTIFDPSGVRPPDAEPGGMSCGSPGDCTGAYEGADCAGGRCYIPKNRYLSVDPTVNFGPVAYQVEVSEATDYPTAEGRTWWVDEPLCYDYPNGIVVDPPPSTCEGPDRFGWVSNLSGTLVERAWSETPIHIAGCGIAPVVTFLIRATNDGGSTWSPDLVINTAHRPQGGSQFWGDITGGPVDGIPGLWLAPERTTNLADVQAGIRTFENRTEDTGFPPRVWVDMEINQVVNFGDIDFMIKAFAGTLYADLPDLEFIGVHPADCP